MFCESVSTFWGFIASENYHFPWSTFTCKQRNRHLHLLQNRARLHIEGKSRFRYRSQGENMFSISCLLLSAPDLCSGSSAPLSGAAEGWWELRLGGGLWKEAAPGMSECHQRRENVGGIFTPPQAPDTPPSPPPVIPNQHHKLCWSSWC